MHLETGSFFEAQLHAKATTQPIRLLFRAAVKKRKNVRRENEEKKKAPKKRPTKKKLPSSPSVLTLSPATHTFQLVYVPKDRYGRTSLAQKTGKCK